MARKTGNYDEYHIERLKDPQNAAAFINAVIEDNDREAFLLALKEVAQAQGGMTAIAEKTHVSRSSLYKTLSKKGNPEFIRISKLLHGMTTRDIQTHLEEMYGVEVSPTLVSQVPGLTDS